MSKRFKMMSTAIAALLCGSLFGGCGWWGGGWGDNAVWRIVTGILNEEIWG